MSSDDVRRARLLRIVVVALIGLGAALRLWNATRELPELLRTTLPDDAFYYFAIARHLALGHAPSIDGVNATNGYHPLWLAMLVPVWRVIGTADAQTPIRAAMILGAVLDVGASAMLFRVCRRLGLGAFASCVALFVFVVSPQQVTNATCGLETPLALLLGLALVSAALGRDALEHPLRLGVLAGLALLARTDQLILVLAVVGTLAVHARERRWAARVAGTTLAVYAPWLVYSFVTTGTVIQSSGVALSFVHRNIPRVWGYEQQSLVMFADRAWSSMREALWLLVGWTGLGALGLGLVLGMFVMTLVRAREPGQETTRRALIAAAPLLGSTLVLFFAHTLGRSVFREWYSAPFFAALCIIIGILVDHFRRTFATSSVLLGVVVTLLVGWTVMVRLEWSGAGYFQTIAGSPGTDPHEGHSDCGVVSYFTGEGITNLDGIVNQRALVAMTGGRLIDYLEQEKFSRLYVTSHFQSPVFLGPHAWEKLIRLDGHALRFATDEEKGRRIGPTTRELTFQWNEAVEYLSDGWSCCGWPPAGSVGPSSELAFALPQPSPEARLELRLSAAVTNDAGVQPVTVSLEGKVLANLEVRSEPRLFSIPLDGARQGRNRLRLEYGAPRSLPPDRNQLSWWRSDWGEPMLAVRAHGLWLHAPMPLGRLDLSATADARLQCEGCYEPEQSATESWRWTNGHARLKVKAAGAPGTHCQVNVVLGAGRLTAVRWDGAPFGASSAFAVVLDGREGHDLELESETFAAQGDARTLGVSLQRVVLECE